MKKKFFETTGRMVFQNRGLLTFNFLVLAFNTGGHIRSLSKSTMNRLDLSLFVFTDHYYILYFMLPIVLAIAMKNVRSFSSNEIIRYPNYRLYRVSAFKDFVVFLNVYFFSQFIFILILPTLAQVLIQTSQTLEQGLDSGALQIHQAYIEIFGTSGRALVSIFIYFIFGFSLLYALLVYIHQKSGQRWALLFLILMYGLTFIGFKTEWGNNFPYFFFNKYIVLHHALLPHHWVTFLSLFLLGLVLFSWTLLPQVPIKSSIRQLILPLRIRCLAFSLVLALFILEVGRILPAGGTGKEALLSIFWGNFESGFMEWFKISFLYLLPVFIIGLAESSAWINLDSLAIRFQNKLYFQGVRLRVYLGFLVQYALVLAALVAFVSLWSDPLQLGGQSIDLAFFARFLFLFFIYLLVDVGIFTFLQEKWGSLTAFILLVILKFISWRLPQMNLIQANLGLSNILISEEKELAIKVALLVLIGGLVVLGRSNVYGNHRHRKPI